MKIEGGRSPIESDEATQKQLQMEKKLQTILNDYDHHFSMDMTDKQKVRTVKAAAKVITTPDEELPSLAWDIDDQAIDHPITQQITTQDNPLRVIATAHETWMAEDFDQLRRGKYDLASIKAAQQARNLSFRRDIAVRIALFATAIEHGRPITKGHEKLAGTVRFYDFIFRKDKYAEFFEDNSH